MYKKTPERKDTGSNLCRVSPFERFFSSFLPSSCLCRAPFPLRPGLRLLARIDAAAFEKLLNVAQGITVSADNLGIGGTALSAPPLRQGVRPHQQVLGCFGFGQYLIVCHVRHSVNSILAWLVKLT